MINSEVHDLIDSLLSRLDELEGLSGAWMAAHRRADRAQHISTSQARVTFQNALLKQRRVQTKTFDAIEAFLAAWARLSLLFFPDAKAPGAKDRARVLRAVYLMSGGTSPLADRKLRNVWMHFDERLDLAIEQRTLGNRHQFTTSAKGARAAVRSLRVVEMDSLVVWYRDRRGVPSNTDVRNLRGYLEALYSQSRKT